MQFKYCPQCGSMEFTSAPNGVRCRKCSYSGPMSEGPMDKINELRKRSGRTASAIPSSSTAPTPGVNAQSIRELEARLKALKGKSNDDVEFL